MKMVFRYFILIWIPFSLMDLTISVKRIHPSGEYELDKVKEFSPGLYASELDYSGLRPYYVFKRKPVLLPQAFSIAARYLSPGQAKDNVIEQKRLEVAQKLIRADMELAMAKALHDGALDAIIVSASEEAEMFTGATVNSKVGIKVGTKEIWVKIKGVSECDYTRAELFEFDTFAMNNGLKIRGSTVDEIVRVFSHFCVPS